MPVRIHTLMQHSHDLPAGLKQMMNNLAATANTTTNPLGLDGFEFIEFACPKPGVLLRAHGLLGGLL
ncbi:MAG: hypothetical protein R3F02_07295 [Thiolinea sp.]